MRYLDKTDEILERAKGKRVMHLGCVGFTDLPANERIAAAKKSLHWASTQVASVVGVDNSAEVVDQLREHAVLDDIIVGDVEQLQNPVEHRAAAGTTGIPGGGVEHLLSGIRTRTGAGVSCRESAIPSISQVRWNVVCRRALAALLAPMTGDDLSVEHCIRLVHLGTIGTFR